eukprot:augustus_masked-scaffold_11-processed-gene-3.40-mRNA-1 protein AED:1.00 eAED:1.00 QI:0/-1/0/0/-1/1/1/0/285
MQRISKGYENVDPETYSKGTENPLYKGERKDSEYDSTAPPPSKIAVNIEGEDIKGVDATTRVQSANLNYLETKKAQLKKKVLNNKKIVAGLSLAVVAALVFVLFPREPDVEADFDNAEITDADVLLSLTGVSVVMDIAVPVSVENNNFTPLDVEGGNSAITMGGTSVSPNSFFDGDVGALEEVLGVLNLDINLDILNDLGDLLSVVQACLNGEPVEADLIGQVEAVALGLGFDVDLGAAAVVLECPFFARQRMIQKLDAAGLTLYDLDGKVSLNQVKLQSMRELL